jgi:hypothetical protein
MRKTEKIITGQNQPSPSNTTPVAQSATTFFRSK